MRTRHVVRMARLLTLALLTSIALAACGGAPATTAPAAGGKVKIGFLYVGPTDDYGYNYAADQGRLYLQKTLGDKVETVSAENVPEDANAERVMEQMINNGATIIFPTSYGHFKPAVNESKKHTNIDFWHQGGLAPDANVGSFFGEIWQMVYASGVAAGKMSKTGKLGYIVAFPIPQVLENVNAFELGAKSVNPNATTTVVFTASWCDPAKNSAAANSLIDQGVDVLTQHQDCPKPVIETAEKRGVMSVGYHADASPVAKTGWITGAVWNWGPIYTKLAEQAIDGKFKPELLRFGVKDGVVDLAPFGANVPKDVQDLVTQVKQDIISGKVKPFQGPIKNQDGKVVIEGAQPDTITLEKMDYLVEGVIGTIPK